MKYPCRSPFLLYNRIDEDSFRIHNILDAKSYHLNLEFVSFLRQLNGRRDPYTIFPRHSKWYIRQLIRELKHCGMLAPEKSFVRLGLGCYIFPLFYCYFGRIAKKLAKLWNYFLLLACIPVLILGIRTQTYILTHPYLLAYGVKNVKACIIPGLLLGLSIAAICHELSHAYVALAYKGHIYMMGVGIHFFMPTAFVFMDIKHIRNKFYQMQIHAAGIEMNFLLYGIFMGMVLTHFFNPFIMYSIAIVNLLTGIFNLFPITGLDGLKILSAFLEKKDLFQSALNRIKYPKETKTSSTCFNIMSLVASYVLVILQLLIPLSIVLELYGWIDIILYVLS